MLFCKLNFRWRKMDSIVNRLMDYINRNYSDLDYTQQDIIKYGLEILLIKLFFNFEMLPFC